MTSLSNTWSATFVLTCSEMSVLWICLNSFECVTHGKQIQTSNEPCLSIIQQSTLVQRKRRGNTLGVGRGICICACMDVYLYNVNLSCYVYFCNHTICLWGKKNLKKEKQRIVKKKQTEVWRAAIAFLDLWPHSQTTAFTGGGINKHKLCSAILF